uniref:VWA domain-containing protein n=1 Tax=Succinivibrio sp. TaxID=2053619 RepID=UPI00402ABC6A
VHEMGHASFTYDVGLRWRDRDPVRCAEIKILRETKICHKTIHNIINVYEDLRVDDLVSFIVPNAKMFGEYYLMNECKKFTEDRIKGLLKMKSEDILPVMILFSGYQKVYDTNPILYQKLEEMAFKCFQELKSRLSGNTQVVDFENDLNKLFKKLKNFQSKVRSYTGAAGDMSFDANIANLLKDTSNMIVKYFLKTNQNQPKADNGNENTQDQKDQSQDKNSSDSDSNQEQKGENNSEQDKSNSSDEKSDKQDKSNQDGSQGNSSDEQNGSDNDSSNSSEQDSSDNTSKEAGEGSGMEVNSNQEQSPFKEGETTLYSRLEEDSDGKDERITEALEDADVDSQTKEELEKLNDLTNREFAATTATVGTEDGVLVVANDHFVNTAKNTYKFPDRIYKDCHKAVISENFIKQTVASEKRESYWRNIANVYGNQNKLAKSLITKALQTYKPKLHTAPAKSGCFLRQNTIHQLALGREIKKPFLERGRGTALNTSIVTLLDVSGSMGGKKEDCLAGLMYNLQQIFENFRCNNQLQVAIEAYSDRLYKIKDFNEKFSKNILNRIPTSNGGTSGDEAITWAVDKLRNKEGRKIIVLMTDGQFAISKYPVNYGMLAASGIEVYSIFLKGHNLPEGQEHVFQEFVDEYLPKVWKWIYACPQNFDKVFLKLLSELLKVAA